MTQRYDRQPKIGEDDPSSRRLAFGALGVVAVTVFGMSLGDSNAVPDRPAFAVCTGTQKIDDVGSGKTLTGLIEAYVNTAPKDHLKNARSLELIANAVTYNDENPLDDTLYVYDDRATNPVGLTAGQSVSLPKECHS